jgi:hypothetical protein
MPQQQLTPVFCLPWLIVMSVLETNPINPVLLAAGAISARFSHCVQLLKHFFLIPLRYFFE